MARITTTLKGDKIVARGSFKGKDVKLSIVPAPFATWPHRTAAEELARKVWQDSNVRVIAAEIKEDEGFVFLADEVPFGPHAALEV